MFFCFSANVSLEVSATSVDVMYGSDVTVMCTATGRPIRDFTWEKIGRNRPILTSRNRPILTSPNSLVYQLITDEEPGRKISVLHLRNVG